MLFLLKKTVAAITGGLRLPPQAAGLVIAVALLSLLAMGVSVYLALFAGRSLLPGPPRTAATQTPSAASVNVPSPQSPAAPRSAPARGTLPAAGPLAPSSQLTAPAADRQLEDAAMTAAVPRPAAAVTENRPPVSGERPVEAESSSTAAERGGNGKTGDTEDIRSRDSKTAAAADRENAAHSSGGASRERAFKADRD